MDKNYDHKQYEEKIYKAWEKDGVFKPGTGKPYTILMPPPNANASLHAGHGMYTVEDILTRWKRMQGFSALWIPGMDHAGFETQYVYEKHLAKEGKSRFDFDRETLYHNVFDFVKNNSGLIYEQFKRLGFSADWSRSVFTLDKPVIDRVFETFKKMAEERLVYRSDYLVNYCTHDGTSLAELEVKHEEREDCLYYLKYGPLVLATVRPETKFGDTAIAVHPEDRRYAEWIGKEIEIEGLLGKFKLKVIADEAVDPEFGTGIVKVTPAHDPNDFEMSKRHNLEIKQVIDLSGRLTDIAGPYAGLKVKAARERVVADLNEKGLIEKVNEHYLHAVTTCYKCGRDLEPMIIPNWFVKVSSLKPAVIKAVKEKRTRFYPKRFEKQFLDWMEIMHDWPISRQIAWGIRIPVWYKASDNPDIQVSFLDPTRPDRPRKGGRLGSLLKTDSIHTLKEDIKLSDWRDGFIDTSSHAYTLGQIKDNLQEIKAPKDAKYIVSKVCPGEDYLQETDTFDTWFSSGQWPLVTLKDEELDSRFPTDVMGTLSEILKFWISRMMMFSLYLKDEVPFKKVYLWSMVTDAKGIKMSKSKGNVVNPIELVDKYGADAFRMSLILGTKQGGKVILAEDRARGMRNFANKIWNAGRYVDENSKLPPKADRQELKNSKHEGDGEFKNKLKSVVEEVTGQLESLKIGLAAETVYNEFWHWFCDEAIEDHKSLKISDSVLTEGLTIFLKLLHPFVPFVTEAVWQEVFPNEGLLAAASWPIMD